uniref:protein PSK SIMULATOR 2-like isoform X2 n=1 Tax=Erigeron canadensis TaxID=72917 RepID=UPI001CB8C327|nr:protein PSK SIMULATOR 2-like isoform X2 [Erigeron canadensis]
MMSFDASEGLESEPSTSTYRSIVQWLQPCRKFKLDEVLSATENFNESLVIGSGGFGKVYKGKVIIGTRHIVAAIKRLDMKSDQGPAEFWAEVEMLSKLRHSHLVSLFGYCNYEREMILIYEYMPNGTLEDHLHKLHTCLSWVDRLKICIGAARGLDYLHTGTSIEFGVIHRDVKSSNILLHKSWEAKISDFGLSRISPTNQLRTYVNTLVKGTFGYLDPNYFATGKLTRKSDVYAFGVVLFEVLCRKQPLDRSLEYGLAALAQDSIKKGHLKSIVDSDIRGEISPKCLKGFARIAERCLEYHPEHRPTMKEVILSLESLLTLQLQTPGRSIFTRMINAFPYNSTGETPARNKVSILAFEVANTIVKGSNLMQSLSELSIHILEKEILHSEGVQLLVSTDTKELLRIAASDKREELEVFSREVVRFGDMCMDPQWHHLDRFFSREEAEIVRLDLHPLTNSQLREKAEITMQKLTNLAQYTFDLYHEYHALDRFEQDYRRKLDEVEALHLPKKGESLSILVSDVKHQRKLVRNLKKKSLWSKSLDEIVEKLVDVVTFIPHAIAEAFEENVPSSIPNGEEAQKKPEKLGAAGLALHYANLVTQMDNIASRPISLPPNMRDNLYNGLPANVKVALRSRLQALDRKEVMTMPQIKAEMEKTLQWLVPVATDTTKAHQGFGWVGEWANTGNEFGKKTAGSNNIIRLQTLYHADKTKMDRYILDLIIWLHRLISLVRFRDKVPKYIPARSPPTNNGLLGHSDPSRLKANGKPQRVQISLEAMLDVLDGLGTDFQDVTTYS